MGKNVRSFKEYISESSVNEGLSEITDKVKQQLYKFADANMAMLQKALQPFMNCTSVEEVKAILQKNAAETPVKEGWMKDKWGQLMSTLSDKIGYFLAGGPIASALMFGIGTGLHTSYSDPATNALGHSINQASLIPLAASAIFLLVNYLHEKFGNKQTA